MAGPLPRERRALPSSTAASRALELYARFRWIVKLGSDLYLVYTHNGLDELGRFSTLERTATTKLNYTQRF